MILAISHGILMVTPRSDDDDFDFINAPWSPIFLYRVVVGGESFDEGSNAFTIGLWGVGSSVGCVVLMNFVIADMGSTYERVKERSTVVRRKELVGLLLEAERIISIPAAGRRFLDRVLGEYLFICMKATQRDDSAVDAWDSFTGSIKNHTHAVEKRLTEGMRKIEGKMETMFASLTSQLNATARVDSQEERETSVVPF